VGIERIALHNEAGANGGFIAGIFATRTSAFGSGGAFSGDKQCAKNCGLLALKCVVFAATATGHCGNSRRSVQLNRWTTSDA
jgi:hypothetical protein